MRKKVEYYNGKEITKEVLRKINLIELKSIEEGITKFGTDNIKTLRELSNIDKIKPKDEYIILGEDWYIHYIKTPYNKIEIKDWVAITKVKNKFVQTMEMFNALKQILLTYKDSDFYAILRHSTSYPFYKKFKDKGYLNELIDDVDLDTYLEELEKIYELIEEEYNSIEEYILDLNRKKYDIEHIDDYIYHELKFNVSDKFNTRYKK